MGGVEGEEERFAGLARDALEQALKRVEGLDADALVRRRIDRLMAYGAFETVTA